MIMSRCRLIGSQPRDGAASLDVAHPEVRMRHVSLLASLLGLAGIALAAAPSQAHACGGLFCNSSQPVNQSAERILFTANDDGTVTAVIEIQYEGPSEKFSWVLPVPGEPTLAVSSVNAFDRLQQQTNPQFMLQTTFEPGCPNAGVKRGARGSTTADFDEAEHGGVNVVAMGTVGPFDYHVIMVDPDLPEPVDAATMWLESEGYDVTALGPTVLAPYLENGLNLLAIKLSKSSMTGSIRPIMITYESNQPFIPIRPTAVAANDDMGVMVWVGAKSRAIPSNYKALEINEARINWFNPMSTYDDVVSAAADEAGGQGFVTEFAGATTPFANTIVAEGEKQEWQRISGEQDALAMLQDAIGEAAELPAGVSVDDLIGCVQCYASDPAFKLDADGLRKALFEKVYKPMADTQELLGSRDYVTRLYTTMSANEMTLDPAFDFNGDLPDVSNLHVAKQTLGCMDDSWHMELPQGDIVYGTEAGVWPDSDMKDQPAARLVMQLSTKGKGTVVMDNSEHIAQLLVKSARANGDTTASVPGSNARLTGSGDDDCAVSGPGRSGSPGIAGLLMALGAVALARRRTRRG
jgi:hypothetical protein